jgi:glycogen synthase
MSTSRSAAEVCNMKILMTADTVGGVWTYALELARALSCHGVSVVLATMGAPVSTQQRAEAATVPDLKIHAGDFKLEWMNNPWDDVRRAGEWLLELEDRVRPDVVHLNGFAHGALPWRAPTLMVGHSCVLSWWEAVKGVPAPAHWDRYRSEVTRGLHRASLVVAPTRAMLTALEKHYGALARKRVISNGRDAAHFAPRPKESFVLTAGRMWDEAKNLSVLEAVAPHLSWPVYVAGDDTHPEGGRIHTRGVRLLGRLSSSQLAERLGRAAIYALPARYEPFGLSALEAALSECALVLGDIPSLREVWGDAATFVQPNDAPAVRRALQTLIADKELRSRKAEQARLRALEYTPRRMAQSYLEAYCDLVGAHATETIRETGFLSTQF